MADCLLRIMSRNKAAGREFARVGIGATLFAASIVAFGVAERMIAIFLYTVIGVAMILFGIGAYALYKMGSK